MPKPWKSHSQIHWETWGGIALMACSKVTSMCSLFASTSLSLAMAMQLYMMGWSFLLKPTYSRELSAQRAGSAVLRLLRTSGSFGWLTTCM